MSSRRNSRKNPSGNRNFAADGSVVETLPTMKKFRCIMQKIVERNPPDASSLDLLANPKYRKIQKMAIWTADRDIERDLFLTTNKADYSELPLNPGLMVRKQEVTQKEAENPESASMRDDSMESFRKLVRTEYGHAAKLFKAGRKSKQDIITAEDFSYILKRLKLDEMFPKKSQELMFEMLPKNAESGVAIIDIISKIDEIDMRDSQLVASKKEMADIRQFLSGKLDEKRAKCSEGVKSKSEAEGKSLDDAMKIAIGQKTFDLDVGSEELNELIEDIYHKRSTKESTEGFARFLRFSNLKLHEIPFYDLRKSDLEGRRARAVQYEEQCNDPILIARHLETRKNQIDNAKEIALLEKRNIEARRVETLGRWDSGLEDHPLGPKKKTSSIEGGGVVTEENSVVSTRSNSYSNSPHHSGKSSVSLGLDSYDGRDDRHHSYPSLHPSGGANQSDKRDFYPQRVRHTKTKHSDPSSLLLVEPSFNRKKPSQSGKRFRPTQPTDFGRVGYGSNSTLYDSKPIPSQMTSASSTVSLGDMSEMSEESRCVDNKDNHGRYTNTHECSSSPCDPTQRRSNFNDNNSNNNSNSNNSSWVNTSSSNRLTELTSTSASENSFSQSYIGSDDKVVRDAKRLARYNRGFLHLERTQRRLEEAALDLRIKEMRNMKSRNEDSIRYDTTVFANDLKGYRSQPLQVMSRKPFMTRSDRMWGGNQNSVQAK